VLLRADQLLDSHAVAFNELPQHRLWMLELYTGELPAII
jgi:hypothetical protein